MGAGARAADRTAQPRSLQRRASAAQGRPIASINGRPRRVRKRPVGRLDFENFRVSACGPVEMTRLPPGDGTEVAV